MSHPPPRCSFTWLAQSVVLACTLSRHKAGSRMPSNLPVVSCRGQTPRRSTWPPSWKTASSFWSRRSLPPQRCSKSQPQSTLPEASETALPPTGTPAAIFPIDINTASSLELELLPQIGPVRAARIVAYRQAHGPFKDIAAIQNVYDINPEVYAAIRDLIIAAEPRNPTPSPSSTP